MTLLRVLTRCYRRPAMLQRNIASLCAQSSDDWEQTLLVDTVGVGVPAAQRVLAEQGRYLEGAYVWVLDDDDECIRPTLVEELQGIAAMHDPDVVMVRMERNGAELPEPAYWGRAPQVGHVTCSGYIVRRALWQQHADAWGAHYSGDFDFIAAVFATDPEVYWHDVVASAVQRISYGEPE
jgi:hypothetical protein